MQKRTNKKAKRPTIAERRALMRGAARNMLRARKLGTRAIRGLAARRAADLVYAEMLRESKKVDPAFAAVLRRNREHFKFGFLAAAGAL